MKLKYAIKHDGKKYPVGKYNGGLPKKVEKDFIDQGYFDLAGESDKSGEPESEVLTLEEISKLPVAKLKKVAKDLDDVEILEVIDLEEAKGDDARSSVIDHLNGMLD